MISNNTGRWRSGWKRKRELSLFHEERKATKMFTLEYLKENSLVSTNGEDGSLYRGTLDFLRTYFPQITFEETSQIPEGQPEELRPFWLAYERAKKALKKEETISVDDFYAEWSKNPADFAPVKKTVIGDLKSILDKYQDRSKKTNVTLYNYDGLCSWTHGHEDFVEALKGLGNITCDVTDVIEFEDPVLKKTILKITTQCDDYDLFRCLAVNANSCMADRVFSNTPK